MFDDQKFLTRGIESEIPAWLVHLMWHMVLDDGSRGKRLPAGIQADENADRSAHRPRAGAAAVPLRTRCTV